MYFSFTYLPEIPDYFVSLTNYEDWDEVTLTYKPIIYYEKET